MNKLELTFTDEVGTNLNQYKMKRNVGTASETEEVIQLERDANITTQGTIINADKLNAMVSAINEPISSLFTTIYEETQNKKSLPLNTNIDFALINSKDSTPLSFSKFSCLFVFRFYFMGTDNIRRYASVTIGTVSSYLFEHSEIVQIYDSFADTTQKVKILLDKTNNTITITNLTNSNTTTNVLYIESIIGA